MAKNQVDDLLSAVLNIQTLLDTQAATREKRIQTLEAQVVKIRESQVDQLEEGMVGGHRKARQLKLALATAKVTQARRDLAVAEIELAKANLHVTTCEIELEEEVEQAERQTQQLEQEEPPLDTTDHEPAHDASMTSDETKTTASKKKKKKKNTNPSVVHDDHHDGQQNNKPAADAAGQNVSRELSRTGPVERDKDWETLCVRTVGTVGSTHSITSPRCMHKTAMLAA